MNNVTSKLNDPIELIKPMTIEQEMFARMAPEIFCARGDIVRCGCGIL